MNARLLSLRIQLLLETSDRIHGWFQGWEGKTRAHTHTTLGNQQFLIS